MQITAEFYTPDEADLAAGAVKSYVPDVYDTAISGISSPVRRSHNMTVAPVSAYNTMGDSPSYSTPLLRIGRHAPSDSCSGKYYVRMICRDSDAAKISHILVNRGGHNITVTR